MQCCWGAYTLYWASGLVMHAVFMLPTMKLNFMRKKKWDLTHTGKKERECICPPRGALGPLCGNNSAEEENKKGRGRENAQAKHRAGKPPCAHAISNKCTMYLNRAPADTPAFLRIPWLLDPLLVQHTAHLSLLSDKLPSSKHGGKCLTHMQHAMIPVKLPTHTCS